VKGGGRAPLLSESWAENTIMPNVCKKVAISSLFTLLSVSETPGAMYVKAHRLTDYMYNMNNIAGFKPIDHRLWVKYDLP
jgi:hypothetical protein